MAEKGKIYHMDAKCEALLQEEMDLLQELRRVVQEVGIEEKQSLEVIDTILSHIEELFLLVIVGEVKSGKSSFINALFGEKVCKEGVTPVTDKINIIKYGENQEVREIDDFIIEVHHPFEALRNINIVDTPGTNSLVRRHQEITESFIPRADLCLFVTSIDRPFTESERKLLSFISQDWGKKIIFILSKVDMKEPEEIEEVITFIEKNCKRHLRFTPRIFPVSSRLAYIGKVQKDQESWHQSNFSKIEEYIFDVLSDEERVKLKLSSPIHSAMKVIRSIEKNIDGRASYIDRDLEVIQGIKTNLTEEKGDMKENYGRYTDKINTVLFEMEKWGHGFFQENINLSNVSLLWKTSQRRYDSEKRLIRDMAAKIDFNMEEALDWLFKATKKLWNRSLDDLRDKLHPDRYGQSPLDVNIDEIQDRDREGIADLIRRLIRNKLDSFDVEVECNRILKDTYSGMVISVGAVAVGIILGLILLALPFWLFKFLGIVMVLGSIFAAVTFMPRKKKQAGKIFAKRIGGIGKDLKDEMSQLFDKEIDRVVGRIEEEVNSRESYLAREKERAQRGKDALTQVKNKFEGLKGKIKDISI